MATTRSTKTPPPRAKRTKTEVQREFAELETEIAAVREAADPKAEQLAALKEAEARQAVEGVTVEVVVQRMAGLSLEITKAISELSAKMVGEVGHLSELRQVVDLERRELDRLHKIDVAATALDQLLQEYAREKERLEAEIAAQRTTWEEETGTVERERREQEEALKKQRQREIEEYEYKKALERKKAQDKHEEEVRLRDKQNQEKQEALEKSWAQREATLKEREEEYQRLKKEADSFPARLDKEAKQAATEAARAAEARLEQQMLLLKKDAEGEKRIADLRIQALDEHIARQAAQIAALEKQLDEAKKQVQDIAVKAIEGASGSKALSHINQIAMEQARQRQQS
jgi:hypothetical protein